MKDMKEHITKNHLRMKLCILGIVMLCISINVYAVDRNYYVHNVQELQQTLVTIHSLTDCATATVLLDPITYNLPSTLSFNFDGSSLHGLVIKRNGGLVSNCVITGPASASIIQIGLYSNNVIRLEGVTVQYSGTPLEDIYAVKITANGFNSITEFKSNVFSNNFCAVQVVGLMNLSNNLTVEDNVFFANTTSTPNGHEKTGLYVTPYTPTFTCNGNTFDGGYSWSINAEYLGNAHFQNNVVNPTVLNRGGHIMLSGVGTLEVIYNRFTNTAVSADYPESNLESNYFNWVCSGAGP